MLITSANLGEATLNALPAYHANREEVAKRIIDEAALPLQGSAQWYRDAAAATNLVCVQAPRGLMIGFIGDEPTTYRDFVIACRKKQLACGGRAYWFETFDGERIVTHNLDCPTRVPECFADLFVPTHRCGGELTTADERAHWDGLEAEEPWAA